MKPVALLVLSAAVALTAATAAGSDYPPNCPNCDTTTSSIPVTGPTLPATR